MNTQLNRIQTPDLSRSDFGRALAEQFANIDINFQKLGNLGLSKGDKGASCVYIIYNLNAIFVYPTCTEAENPQEYKDFNLFKTIISSPMLTDKVVADRYQKIKDGVEKDYAIYKAHTGGSETEYVRMCAYLLWGTYNSFLSSPDYPTKESLTGTLWNSKAPELQKDMEVKDVTGKGHVYKSVWLKDWYEADLSGKHTIYKDHILLFDPGKITIACTPTVNGVTSSLDRFEPVGSLAYVHVDPRFRNENTGDLLKDISTGESGVQSIYEDISCVVYWEPRDYHSGDDIPRGAGGFKSVNLFPQIYFDGSGFFWKINGNNTRIPATGIAGAPGKNSQLFVVERVENVIGATPDCPQGDIKAMTEMGLKDACGAWLPEYNKTGETIVVNTQSGRTSRVETLRGKRAAEFQSAYSQMPGIENEITEDGVNPQQAKVLSYKVTGKSGWMIGNSATDNTEVEHTFRILRIMDKECFYEATKPIKTKQPFRPLDPSFAAYNYGDPDAVVVSNKQDIQQLIASLDGCACVVVPGPAFRPDRTDSTVWFSTLKAVRIDNSDSRLELIAYCGIENQMATNLDDHSFAGHMHELDAYTYKATGDFRNKPRGFMLPIGSANVYSDNKEEVWGAHIIHSDLGGFTHRHKSTDAKNGDYFWGEQQEITENNSRPVLGLNIPADNLDNKGYAVNTHQFLEVINKRFIHIGSVNDYRSLNYVSGLESGTKTFNAAVPGRQRDIGYNWEGVHAQDGSVKEYYGHSGFWGVQPELGWFMGSELHVDEPLTITRYRDLQKRKHLLTVEGDVLIGPHIHVNDPSIAHRYKDGGLIIQSTISQELRDRMVNESGTESIFDTIFYSGITARYSTFLNPNVGGILGPTREQLCRSIDITDGYDYDKYYGGYRGMWQERSTDDLYPGDTEKLPLAMWEFEAKKSYPSLLAEDMIGARMFASLDGLFVYNQNPSDEMWDEITDTPWNPTKFSVDYEGNIQTYGREIRANYPDAIWLFHTDWKKAQDTYTNAEGETDKVDNPTANQLVFGLSHKYIGTAGEGAKYWKGAKATENTDDIPAGWVTDMGYIDGRATIANYDWNGPAYAMAYDVKNLRLRNLANGTALLPSIVRIWSDLLYQQGSMTVAGLSLLPVQTHWDPGDYMPENYQGRYGLQVAHGMIIGGPGREKLSSDDIKKGNLLGSELRVNYNGAPSKDDIDNSDSEYTSTGAGLGQGDGDSGTPVDMFFPYGMHTSVGLWVKSSGVVVDDAALIGTDIHVGQAAFIREQARAKSFRRHVCSLNLDEMYNGYTKDASYRSAALLMDRGWSSARAKQMEYRQIGKSFEPVPLAPEVKEAPIILDMGQGYGRNRFVKFGVTTMPEIDSAGNIIKKPANPEDHNLVFYGVNPAASMFVRKSDQKLWKNKDYNHFEVVGQSNGMIACVTLTIKLDWLVRCGYHKNTRNGRGHAVWAYTVGINPDAHYYDESRKNTSGVSDLEKKAYIGQPEDRGIKAEFDGWNWDEILGADFPKPAANVSANVPSIAATQSSWLFGANGAHGIRFVLTTDGRLLNDYSIGAGAMCSAGLANKSGKWRVQEPNSVDKTLTINFTYPISLEPIQTIYRYGWSRTGDTSTIQVISPTPSSEPQPSEQQPIIWRKTYVGSSTNPTEDDWNKEKWEQISVYSKDEISYYATTSKADSEDENGNMIEVPPTWAANNTLPPDIIRKFVYVKGEDGQDTPEVDWAKTIAQFNTQTATYKYAWQLTKTTSIDVETGNLTTNYLWVILYSAGLGRAREIKVLFSGIIYRKPYEKGKDPNVSWGQFAADAKNWKLDKCYGPAVDDIEISFDHSTANKLSGNMVVGFKHRKWVITSSHATQAVCARLGAHVTYLADGKGGHGFYAFQCLPFQRSDFPMNFTNGEQYVWDPPYNGDYQMPEAMRPYDAGVIVWVSKLRTNGEGRWDTGDWEHIYAFNITIFGFEQEE